MDFLFGCSIGAVAVLVLTFVTYRPARSIFDRSPWTLYEVSVVMLAQMTPRRCPVGNRIIALNSVVHAFPSAFGHARKEFGR